MMDEQHYGFHRLEGILTFVNLTVGLLLGLSCIIGGLTLTIFGAVSHTSWTMSLFGLSNSVNDAAPGVLLFIVGSVLLLITRDMIFFLVLIVLVDFNGWNPNRWVGDRRSRSQSRALTSQHPAHSNS